ncbi:MAG: 50S ribosomal protein L25 [Nitrospinaceae bacterium]|nr:50S ribosomal protein L25 [Nitrospinaceae bacterium]NIR56100.1 50S ribosomal protein L25 [Nitrospinaceae bacterium]NIS86548.1 50S ribosomal protein L25 [Nitrospinaceae bacterium]NIT83382.1 50S ribosomal protein L25 [Nitrospinaceae bacterium]NIU45592.1 50S ribosomal protein L25 [Nitrospinaceae bacterium]
MAVALNGKIREGRGKGANRRLRAEGRLPAVLYGGKSNVSLWVNPKELKKIIDKEGINSLIELAIEGDSEPKRTVVVKTHQRHPVREGWVHADFLEVDMSQKIKVAVPILLVGQSPGEKLGGLVEHNLNSLNIKCLPGEIPESFKVDMTKVEMDQVVHISDLEIPEHFEILDQLSESVVSVHEVKVKEEKAEEEVEGVEEGAEAPEAAKAEEKGEAAEAEKS